MIPIIVAVAAVAALAAAAVLAWRLRASGACGKGARSPVTGASVCGAEDPVARLRRVLNEPLSEALFRQELGQFGAAGKTGPASAGGNMGQASTLMRQIEQESQSSIEAMSETYLLGEHLEGAAKRRLALALAMTGEADACLYALMCAKELCSLHLSELDQVAQRYRELKGLPDTWDVRVMLQTQGFRLLEKTELEAEMIEELQKIVDDSFLSKLTRDRRGNVPKRLVLTGGFEVENAQNWTEYVARRRAIAEEMARISPAPWKPDDIMTMMSPSISSLPEVDESVNEAWFFHGTSALGAEGITSEDFKLDLAGSNAGTLYGRGVYLAECCTKSDEYAGDNSVTKRHLLLCRSVLGNIHYTDKAVNDADALVQSCLNGPYHSVLGDRAKARGTYREFIVYDNEAVYPAYILEYRQEF